MHPKIKSVQRSKKVCMCIYGPPGAGKTRLAGSGGKGTLILRPPTDHTDSITSSLVKEWVIKDWQEMNEVSVYLNQEGSKWDWVWLDSVSLWQDQGLDDLWNTIIEEKPARERFGLDQGDYGVNMHRTELFIRDMVNLSKERSLFNFGITAHPIEENSPSDDEKYIWMPYLQGKQRPQKLCGYMNIVGYLAVPKKNSRANILYARESERFYGKDQFLAFPTGKLANPTMAKIEKLIAAARGTTTPARKGRRGRKKSV